MTGTWRTRKAFRWIAATLASMAALATVALAYPRPISMPALGAGWECRATAFSTSCTRVQRAVPSAHRFGDGDPLAAGRKFTTKV
jgi:hypothetical protein